MPPPKRAKVKNGKPPNGEDPINDGVTSNAAAAAAAARAQVFDALQAEMELADYARGVSGQKVKRVPRNQAPFRTAKRKAMQEVDMMEMAIEVGDDYQEEGAVDVGIGGSGTGAGDTGRRKRLRGSKVAFDDVVLKSMPLAFNNLQRKDDAESTLCDDRDVRNEMLKDVAELGIELGLDDDSDYEDDDREEGSDVAIDDVVEVDDDGEINLSSDFDDSGDEQVEKDINSKKQLKRKNVSVSKNGLIIKPKTTKRVMHRLRDFASQRLAEKHGEAIGAHIRGMSETAVQKLREVAKAAPGAPQVYSSLGMVYESMLTETEEGNSSSQNKDDDIGCDLRLNLLQRRMELAHKTYASYHVASLLTKRDFVLWERSGDAAMKVGSIYSEIIDHMAKNPVTNYDTIRPAATASDAATRKQAFDPFAGAGKWRSDQQVWMEHALSAYQSSDNLRPPGVDIPCKLALVHMSLGRYIDALSILTDLRNKAHGKKSEQDTESRHSAMEGSYPCWLLYADLMMKIGYECKQWIEGKCNNQNYMFKRWLRQNAKDFDWRERRLQALCLAFEAAAGSASCVKLIKWMRERAEIYIVKNGKDVLELEVDDDNEDDDPEKTRDAPPPKRLIATKSTYDEERERLLAMNKVELQKFDRMTKEMNLIAESHIYRDRIASRAALVENQRASMKDLAMRKFAEEQQTTSTPSKVTVDPEADNYPKPLPLQGSCATVYDIAALLLKQCVEQKCYDGGLLVIKSVLDYLAERVTRYERRLELQREKANVNNSGQGLVQPAFRYDQVRQNFASTCPQNAVFKEIRICN